MVFVDVQIVDLSEHVNHGQVDAKKAINCRTILAHYFTVKLETRDIVKILRANNVFAWVSNKYVL